MIRRDPVGVVTSIAPWNYPLMMAARKLARRWRRTGCGSDKTLGDHPLTARGSWRGWQDIFPEELSTCCLAAVKRWATP